MNVRCRQKQTRSSDQLSISKRATQSNSTNSRLRIADAFEQFCARETRQTHYDAKLRTSCYDKTHRESTHSDRSRRFATVENNDKRDALLELTKPESYLNFQQRKHIGCKQQESVIVRRFVTKLAVINTSRRIVGMIRWRATHLREKKRAKSHNQTPTHNSEAEKKQSEKNEQNMQRRKSTKIK